MKDRKDGKDMEKENYEYTFKAGCNAMSRMVAFTRSTPFAETTLEAIKVRLEAIEDAWQQVKTGEKEIAKTDDVLKLAEIERKFAEAEEQFFTASAVMKERHAQLERDERQLVSGGRQEPPSFPRCPKCAPSWKDVLRHWKACRKDTETGRLHLNRRGKPWKDVQRDRPQHNSRPDYRARDGPSTLHQSRVGKTEPNGRYPRASERETIKKMPCNMCRSMDHPIWNCPEFQVLNLMARNQAVKEMRLCPNCLKLGHTPSTCYQEPCTRCPGRQMHNSVLCPMKELRKAEGTVFRVQDERKRRESSRDNKQKRE